MYNYRTLVVFRIRSSMAGFGVVVHIVIVLHNFFSLSQHQSEIFIKFFLCEFKAQQITVKIEKHLKIKGITI